MTRLILATVSTAALLIAAATVALADAGAPGTTFPEQPNANVANACAMVVSNPGTGVGGATTGRISPIAQAITGSLLQDACFEG
jgi:ribonuclease PH